MALNIASPNHVINEILISKILVKNEILILRKEISQALTVYKSSEARNNPDSFFEVDTFMFGAS